MKVIIDGREIEFVGPKTILQIAREAGIYIPSLCDHPLLKPFGACRLCLVEIKGERGLVPACTREAEDGLEIITQSPLIEETRRQTLELILSEHPYVCLVCSEKERCEDHKVTIRKVEEVTGCVFCPKNNQCELQRLVNQLKIKQVKIPSSYRGFEIIRDDPFFVRNYNLCILCGRCVRVCSEVRGTSAIAFVFRGSQTIVGTAYNQPLLQSGCQFCGACVDICPVGVLTEKALRYEVKPDKEISTICPFCQQACHLKVKVKGERILGVEPEDEETLGKMCVRGRFLIRQLVHNPYRLSHPLVRYGEELKDTSADEALDYVVSQLNRYSGEEIALVLSPHLPLEDLFMVLLLAKEGLKTNQVAFSTINEAYFLLEDFSRFADFPWVRNYSPQDFLEAKTIVLIGGDLAVLQPGLWVEVFQAINRGAKLITLDAVGRSYDRLATINLKALPETWPIILQRWLAMAGLASKEEAVSLPLLGDGSEEKIQEAFSHFIRKKTIFLLGPGFWPLDHRHLLISLLNLTQLLEAQLIPFGLESNSRGLATLIKRLGIKPLAWSKIEQDLISQKIKALLSFGPVPLTSTRQPEFCLQVEPYRNPSCHLAQVILPASTALERSGTIIAGNGRIKRFNQVIASFGESRPDWWWACRLGQRLNRDFPGFSHEREILARLVAVFPELKEIAEPQDLEMVDILSTELKEEEASKASGQFASWEGDIKMMRKGDLIILAEKSLDYYRSLPLAYISRDFRQLRPLDRIWLNSEEARHQGIAEGDKVIIRNDQLSQEVIVKISPKIPRGVVVLNSIALNFLSSFLHACFFQEKEGLLIQAPLSIERGR